LAAASAAVAKVGHGLALTFQAQAAAALPFGANPQVANPFPLNHDILAWDDPLR
jgi:hypothetical protein